MAGNESNLFSVWKIFNKANQRDGVCVSKKSNNKLLKKDWVLKKLFYTERKKGS